MDKKSRAGGYEEPPRLQVQGPVRDDQSLADDANGGPAVSILIGFDQQVPGAGGDHLRPAGTRRQALCTARHVVADMTVPSYH